MAELRLMKTLPSGPWHFPIFAAIVWRLYYFLSWPSFTLATVSLFWLVIRLHRVLRQPVDRLIEILGIEVPSPPLLELLEISSDTVSIHWWAAEKYTGTKYSVRVNGVHIGDVTAQDTALSITGLGAGVYYTIRVVASVHGKYHASSDPIRVRTSNTDAQEQEEQEKQDEQDEQGNNIDHKPTVTPSVIPYKGAYEGVGIPLSAPPLVREHSNSLSSPRRRTSLRKTSPLPFTTGTDKRGDDGSLFESSQAVIQALTAKLNELRKETDEQEKQNTEEDRQFQAEITSLTDRRDRMKHELKEKEDSSKDLRKTVAQLERQNQTAQQKRTTQEKALESKHNERRKLREDTERWDRETVEFGESMESMAAEKDRVGQELDDKLQQHREDKEPDAGTVRKLEEQIRDTGKFVKELEETRKDTSEPSDSPRVSEGEIEAANTSREHEDRMKKMQEELGRKYVEVQHAHQLFLQLKSRLQNAVAQRRASQANTYDPNAAEFTPATHAFIGPQREVERRVSLGGYGSSFLPSTATESRNPFPTSLHTNLNQIVAPVESENPPWPRGLPSQADIDRLTGGAMASPSANALLPSDLLGDEMEDASRRHRKRRSGHESGSIGSRPPSTLPPPGTEYHQALRETSDPLPGLGALPGLGSTAAVAGPNQQSPTNESRSPSLTSSPHESIYHRPSDGFIDSDRRSVRSTSSSGRVFGTGRPSRLLGDVFSRQRGKSYTDEGPLLGSLAGSESSSFPRQFDEPGETATGNGQRRGANNLFSSMLGRRALGAHRVGGSNDDITQNQPAGSGRLGSRMFPWSQSSLDASSRPNSVYSAENALPRPLGDIQQPFGWNASSGLNRSNTTASARHHRMNPWSSGSSRRGSAAVDSSGLSEFDQIDEDALPLSDRNESPAQAPIGTKPSKAAAKKEARELAAAKQLNPNARDFRSMFSRERRAERKRDKSASRPDTADAVTDDLGISGTAAPGQESRLHAAGDSAEDVSSTVGRSPRASESGPPTPSDGTTSTRESLMRKLTRKGSHLPGLKGRKTAGSSTPQTGTEDTDEDATGLGTAIVRTPSSLTSSPKVSQENQKEREGVTKRASGFSLNSFTKRRGRKEKDAPSISETSMTSGTDEVEVVEGGSGRGSLEEG